MLVSVTKYEHSWAKKDDEKIWESNLSGVTIDKKLRFDCNIVNICFKANQKLRVLSRLASLLAYDESESF